MADVKITGLDPFVDDFLSDDTLFETAIDPSGTPASRKANKNQVARKSAVYINLSSAGFDGVFDCSDDTLVQQINLAGNNFSAVDASGCGAVVMLRVSENSSMGSLDISGCVAMVNLFAGGSGLATLDASGLLALENINAVGSGGLTEVVLAGCVALVDLSAGDCAIDTVDISDCESLLFCALANNALPEAVVDHILETLDAFGLTEGEVLLDGGSSAPPSASGLAAKASLEGKNWSVAVNV